MSRSTSTISRRAHIASHHHHVARSGTSLGDHSIVVDASTSSQPGSSGGIKNSTINLTSISRRRDSTLSTLSRVVRSLFGRAVPAAPATFTALPLTVSAPVSPSSSSLKRRSVAQQKRRRNPNKLPRRGAPLKKLNRTTHAQRRAVQQVQAVKRDYPINVKLQRRQAAVLEARAMNYTLADAQASAYSAAVAALSDSPYSPAVTAAPTSVSDSAEPTMTAYSTMLLLPTPDGNSPYSGDALSAPNGTLGDAAAARAQQQKQPASVSVSVSMETVTQTVTLVAAPGVVTPGPILGAASSFVSTTIVNPKAAGSAILSSSSTDAQPMPSSAALPTSPPPSTATPSPALQNVKSAFERRRMQPGRRAAIRHEQAAKIAAIKWYKA